MAKMKAIVLAAGKGTRLQTHDDDLPKVMRAAHGKPLLSYVLSGIDFVDPKNITIVVGYKKQQVMDYFDRYNFAEQTEQLGTGHAVMAACDTLAQASQVLVCCGDMPLIKRDTYMALSKTHLKNGNACTILTGTCDLPLPYGRIIRDADGGFLEVVEEKDCDERQQKIAELNSGVYIFDSHMLLEALRELKNDNAQGEYYLTDVPAILSNKGLKIGICMRDLGTEIIGVNTPAQLAQVEKILKDSREG